MFVPKRLLKCCLLLFILCGCASSRKSSPQQTEVVIVDDKGGSTVVTSPVVKPLAPSGNLSKKEISALQAKYAAYIHVSPETITNLRLYSFIDEWLGTPYLWGGTTRNGIDCSAFVQKLLGNVYNINVTIPRTSIEQFLKDWIERFYSPKALAEGDLIFFRTNKAKLISHIGLYLDNGMFVNSSSEGVSIQNLNSAYWSKSCVAYGRIKESARK